MGMCRIGGESRVYVGNGSRLGVSCPLIVWGCAFSSNVNLVYNTGILILTSKVNGCLGWLETAERFMGFLGRFRGLLFIQAELDLDRPRVKWIRTIPCVKRVWVVR